MRKPLLVIILGLMALSISSCGVDNNAPSNTDQSTYEKEVIIFAAASMTEALNEIADQYKNAKLTFNFDSSGTLKTQIEEGAPSDIFISAAKKQMDELGDKIDVSNHVDLLENEVVLATRKDSTLDINSFDDLNTEKVSTIALGNADVPVGQYSEELLTKMGVWDEIKAKATFASNVKEVSSWINEGAVECGIIYATDANTAGLKVVDRADPSMFENRILYPMGIVKDSENKDEVKAFYDYLKTDEASKVFEKYGFKVVK